MPVVAYPLRERPPANRYRPKDCVLFRRDMEDALVLLENAEKEIVSSADTSIPSFELVVSLISAAQSALDQARTVKEGKVILDKLSGIGTYLKKQKAEQVKQNMVFGQRIKTEWVLGGWIPEQHPQGKHSLATLASEGVDDHESRRFQRVHKIDLDDIMDWVYTDVEKDEKTTSGMFRLFMNIHLSDDSYEWNTPLEYINAAKRVMGCIDVDPASNAEAQKIIGAGAYYDAEIDGLSQPWWGNVWLNPPYNMPYVEMFVDRAVDDYENDKITAAIVLTNNSTDTAWCHRLLQYPVCFTRGRIQFWNGKETLATRQGQAFFYLGKNTDSFAKEFGKFGVVMQRYDNH